MNLVDIGLGSLGIIMIARLGQLIANASQRKSLLKLGKQVLIVVVTLILITIYFYSRIFG